MAIEFLDIPLSQLTTLKVGGTADRIVRVSSEDEAIELIAECDQTGSEVLVLGGGSNVVCADEHFTGTVVVMDIRGIDWKSDVARVSAGEDWEEFVVSALERGHGAFTPLSGIPGSVGATPIQNIGAYGVEIADLIFSVRVLDRKHLNVVDLVPDQCDFGYRTSLFKKQPGRYVVLSVTYLLDGAMDVFVGYEQLASVMKVDVGEKVDAHAVRESVLALRGLKSMVVNQEDADSNSTGSFFINPAVTRETAPEGCPQYALKDSDPRALTHVKLSAAWLIENSGISKGFTFPDSDGVIRVSRNHSLAIANTDGGKTQSVIALASHMRQQVFDHFAIELEVEPVLVNCEMVALTR